MSGFLRDVDLALLLHSLHVICPVSLYNLIIAFTQLFHHDLCHLLSFSRVYNAS